MHVDVPALFKKLEKSIFPTNKKYDPTLITPCFSKYLQTLSNLSQKSEYIESVSIEQLTYYDIINWTRLHGSTIFTQYLEKHTADRKK